MMHKPRPILVPRTGRHQRALGDARPCRPRFGVRLTLFPREGRRRAYSGVALIAYTARKAVGTSLENRPNHFP